MRLTVTVEIENGYCLPSTNSPVQRQKCKNYQTFFWLDCGLKSRVRVARVFLAGKCIDD